MRAWGWLLIAFGLSLGTAWPQAGVLVPSGRGTADSEILSIRRMTVRVGIDRAYARVDVTQIFENHTGRAQEATYRFRLPPSASLADFAVWDGAVRIPGVILEKQRARSIYQEVTAQRVDPGLVLQGEEAETEARSGSTTFTVTVSPVPPHATKRVELLYHQDVTVVDGRGELRLPLAPPQGAAPEADELKVEVFLEGATAMPVPSDALPMSVVSPERLELTVDQTRLDRDLVIPFAVTDSRMRLTTYRDPGGGTGEPPALPPWDRPSEVRPEPDGFFLVEAVASGRDEAREPVRIVALFDASLSHRFDGLAISWGRLTRVVEAMQPDDELELVAFHHQNRTLSDGFVGRERARRALEGLRRLPLEPGSDVGQALRLAAGRGPDVRILVLGDGQGFEPGLDTSRLWVGLSGEGVPPATAGAYVLPAAASRIEEDLFLERLFGPLDDGPEPSLDVTGGDAGVRDVYPILVQPPQAGGLSGWIGRYSRPSSGLDFGLDLGTGVPQRLEGDLPEVDLSARHLPRRWARARVDFLLRLIDVEGERTDWIEEIIDLSTRYKFVTPYTAFLAAPRSLLRPRRIQPGDPVIRVHCDPSTRAVTALFDFGLRLPLKRRPGTDTWEGRFLVPEGAGDGRHRVDVVMRTTRGVLVEPKYYVLDSTPPRVHPDPIPATRAGDSVRIAARTDADVVSLTARVGELPPVDLRWDPSVKACVGTLHLPATMSGAQSVFYEAVDGAHLHGVARSTLEVVP